MDRFTEFLKSLEADTYPEPRTELHDKLTVEWLETVTKFIKPCDWVLDVGCGQGPALEWLEDHGFKAVGISTNHNDVEACLLRRFKAHLCDMANLTQIGYGFNMIWARHVLEHSPAPLYALREFYRALEPSGILYIEVPAPDTACCHESNRNHYSVLGHRMWLSLLLKAKFEILESNEIRFDTQAGPDKYWNFICRKP